MKILGAPPPSGAFMTKCLIVNGDDLGASRGINRGIIEAHRRGILTSASLLVNTPWSEEAAQLSRNLPGLSVGLHADLGSALVGWGPDSPRRVRDVLREQLFRFEALMGHLPTHLDSYHNVHCNSRALPHFVDMARRHCLPLRGHSAVRYFPKFYGQWGGVTNRGQISVESLAILLETELEEGITELSCHPGYADPDFSTGYSEEREEELRTLCDPEIRRVLAVQCIRLVSYHELGPLAASKPA
ncbi:MAG: hypothetical protein DMH00_10050 [Acidobacteria bacterium]|nr:MAG: hypothetical protein DMH00_10050 [Acidobacteriota bacterium]